MVVTLLSWVYIFFISLIIGMLARKAISRLIPVPEYGADTHFGITGLVVTGLVTLTVYAEYFSIFYKVGAICHLIMLAVALVGAYFMRKELAVIFKAFTGRMTRNRYIFFAVIVIAAAFFASNGDFHHDTGIYHAQSIRMLEEYGVLKGLGNLQLHFAYNSSYLALCALFSMSFIYPAALHSMTGFFVALFSCYAIDGLFDFGKHKRHGGDFARISLLIYALSNLYYSQSPATDYGAMFMALYVLTAWMAYTREKSAKDDGQQDIAFYGYLAVLSIFTVSMKLSTALLVILALWPAVLLIKKKMFREFGLFLAIGFLSFLPYLIRNVIISGWLLYPVASIDLFNVVWKIPAQYMKVDSDQIKVWGRCLYDVSRVNEGITSWFSPWWSEKQHYEKMLIYSQFVGGILLALVEFLRLREKKFSFAGLLFYVTILANIAMWLFTAPFIRYGLAFLLLFPLCAVGDSLDIILSKKSVVLGIVAAMIVVNFFSWIDDYYMDALLFFKHHATDGYYVAPVPYDQGNMTAVDMDGLTVYVADYDEVSSYYYSPASCYEFMVNRTELIGDTIKDGFKPKD